MAGLSILMAQELDRVRLIKKGVKLNPKTNPNPNKINLQSFFTYHFRNLPVLHKKQTLIHLLGSFTVVGRCLTKQEPSYKSKKRFFSFLEVLKNIFWSKVRLELIKVTKAEPQNMELQCSCCTAGLQLSGGLEVLERMPPLKRHFEFVFL